MTETAFYSIGSSVNLALFVTRTVARALIGGGGGGYIKKPFFSMSRICDKKRSKPKIFLAFLSKLLCFSFIL